MTLLWDDWLKGRPVFRARKNSLGLRALFLFVVRLLFGFPTAYAVGCILSPLRR